MILTPRQALEGRIENDARNIATWPGSLAERAAALCAWSLCQAIDMHEKELERRAMANLRQALIWCGYPIWKVLAP